MNKNELSVAIKNINANNFNLNVMKNQKKNGTADMAKKTFWGGYATVMAGMKLAAMDAKSNFTVVENEWLNLKAQFDEAQKEWLHAAYIKNRLLPNDEPNSSVRYTKNALLRVKYAKMILDDTISNDYELCNRIRKTLTKLGFNETIVNRY